MHVHPYMTVQVLDTYGTDFTDRELAAMPYTTAIIKETLRQKGIVSHVWRKALVDIELGGYRIPKVSPCLSINQSFSLHTCSETCINKTGHQKVSLYDTHRCLTTYIL